MSYAAMFPDTAPAPSAAPPPTPPLQRALPAPVPALSQPTPAPASTEDLPPLWDHQLEDIERCLATPRAYDASDPGTGKTRKHIEVWRRQTREQRGKVLVLATRSILQSAWGNDIERFAPELTYSIAWAHNRIAAFEREADVYITNHDAAKWLAKNPRYLQQFSGGTLVIDEATAFKHRTSQRSVAVQRIASLVTQLKLLSGTPNSNTVLDLWHQYYLIDWGTRLGKRFFSFRNATCYAEQTGPGPEMVTWRDRPGIEQQVADLVADITMRHRFEDCMSIPENFVTVVPWQLSAKLRRIYDEFQKHSIVTLEAGDVTALQASSLKQKLLQIASGAVYDAAHEPKLVDTSRYELILDLVEEREHCLVAFLWVHQRDQLIAEAERRGVSYAVLDGEASDRQRLDAVDRFQAGDIRVIFAHPQSASHGLTLTRGTSTIWASPTLNAEHYKQFNQRIYRGGQHRRTETVLVEAQNTIEPERYLRLQGKLDRQENFLETLKSLCTKA